MVKERNIVVCIILSIITCGVYGIFWFVSLTDDTNTLSGDYKTSGGMAFLFTIITCGLYSLYWMYRQGDKIDQAKANRGIPSSNSGIFYLILSVIGLGIVSYCLMQNEVNQLA